MVRTKKVTITISPEQQEKAREMSKDLFGRENISGLIGFLIERWEKECYNTIEALSLGDVVGRSEQFNCFLEDGEQGERCDSRCNDCKEYKGSSN